MFDGGGLVEGGFADGRGAVLVGGRYSYTAALFSLLTPGTDLDYRDFQVRITYYLTPRDRLGVFAFGSYDLLGSEQNGVASVVFGSEFYRVDARYDRSLGGGGQGGEGHLRWAVTGGLDQSHVLAERNARDTCRHTVEIVQPLSPTLTLRTGVDAEFDDYTADTLQFGDPRNPYTNDYNALFPPRQDATIAARADVVWKVTPRVELTPGVRVDVFRSAGASAESVDGRLALEMKAAPHVRLLNAVGVAHQPPAFLVGVPGLATGNLASGLQTAIQSSAGIEVEWPKSPRRR